ncbi:MAG: hypothetical protein K9I94_15955 [Bacteroidales bacterium]|nr:hypothetical protein [Bacteroidales bacterium]
MPELPDVEVFKRYFDSTSLNQSIRDVKVSDQTVVKIPESGLKSVLIGYQFRKTSRRGKFLFANSGDSNWLVLHFGMTGYLHYSSVKDDPPDHTRLRITFDNENALSYVNMRKLGLVDHTESLKQYIREKNLGPDALHLDHKLFIEIIGRKKGTVKSALMDQSAVAGIGNIYADEILFQAGIHPKRPVSKLNEDEFHAVFRQTDPVLETAIEREAVPGRMPQHFMLPRREPGASCPKCRGNIEKIAVSGRSTFVCPNCQK